MTPSSSARPFVSVFMASSERLKPSPAWSTAMTLIDWPPNDICQHDPHAVEFQPPTAWAAPILGNDGSEPKVVNFFVSRPFAPSEQATVESEAWELSYAVSKRTLTADATEKSATRETMVEVSFMATI